MSDVAEVLIGNICSLGAMLTDSFSGTRKTNRGILLVQCVTQIFYIISSLILKGYSATVQNAVAIFRNLFAASGKSNKYIEYFLIGLPVVLGIIFNNRGWIGILPVVANLEYSISVFVFAKEPVKLKYALIINCMLFCIFNFSILNFVGGIASIVISATTAISIYKEKRNMTANDGH